MSYLHDQAINQLATTQLSAKENQLIAPVLTTYYGMADDDDLSEYTPEALFARIYQHFNLLKKYNGDELLINAYNPTDKAHGYEADCSVIDIITKDRPFLIDSLQMAFVRENLSIHFFTHPIYHLAYQEDNVVSIKNAQESNSENTSVIHIEFDRLPKDKLAEVAEKITHVLTQLRLATDDWQAMGSKIEDVIKDIQSTRNLPQTVEEVMETMRFLEWLKNRHFTFLGYREYELKDDKLYTVAKSGLGVLRDDGKGDVSKHFANLPAHLKDEALRPNLLLLSKSNSLSVIHRPTYMDFVGVKKFDDDGNVVGEHRFLGLLTAEAYRLLPSEIPLLSHKIATVVSEANLPANSHAAKLFNNVLEQLPRDELFQSDVEQIRDMALTVFHMQERDVLRFFARKDTFETFVNCYIYVPKDRYSTKLRQRFEDYLMKILGGYESQFSTHFTESLHVRVNILIRTTAGQVGDIDRKQIEADLTPMMLDWGDEVARLMREQLGRSAGNSLYKRFEKQIPSAYKDDFLPQTAISDFQIVETLLDGEETLKLNLYQRDIDEENQLRLKLYGTGDLAMLSDIMPVLENFGFTVKSASPYQFESHDEKPFWLVNFKLSLPQALDKSLDDIAPYFIEAFTRTWNGIDESDSFDQLVLSQALSPRDIGVLRAISKYMVQAKAPFSNQYMQQAINHNAEIAHLLVDLFHARMALETADRDEAVAKVQKAIEDKLAGVASLDEDRILRWFMIVINAMVRTNFFQQDAEGNFKPYLSFKIESAKIPDLPLPKPLFEIFVYSNDVEAIHLRGGKVARGGLRWSDRVEDFRTEILGLVKAQIVKNSVIVPVGSKGGFIVKHPDHSSREAFVNEGIRCYKIFMRGLLDITDNIVAGKIVPPQGVYRHDADDPYLVVAADKGTATFSDIANGMAAEYGFWLGDAFASGGSVGYDHKGMGITAKGAWESVKRHFRHLGKDIQKEEFTVVGIGDMGGDVFGNGMLLSEKIQLTAAFNHLHIFIDPTPDAAKTFVERKRLFETPRTTWDDFDKSLISKGGGVFSRAEKSIAITPEMKAVFDIEEDELSPNQLINRLLKAPVELLWNGGIGTYVKAESESHDQVGDKANDVLRINGKELRCKVIGEGGNLGMTQLGRVEFAKNGGMVLTDAIDNSAGVNCSDHEVNIKILLNQLVEKGDMTVEARNELLESMTEEVGRLVLRQNYQQPQAISMGVSNRSMFIDHIRIIRQLEKSGRLNRELEFLPSDEEMKQRLEHGGGLYAPELAVMLAYSKIQLFEELIDSELPDASVFQSELSMYFPSALREKYLDAMQTHRLRREIIATFVTNSVLNHMGSVFIHRTKESTGQSSAQIVLAYCASRDILGARHYWNSIDALDNVVAADLQNDLHIRVRRTLDKFSNWFLSHRRDHIDIGALQKEFKALPEVAKLLPAHLAQATVSVCEKEAKSLIEQGVPEALAHELAYMPHLEYALDIIAIASRKGIAVDKATTLYFSIANVLDARWLKHHIESLDDNDYWRRRACYSLTDNLKSTIVAVTEQATKLDKTPAKALEKWQAKFANHLEGYHNCLSEIRQGDVDLSRLSVAIGEMSALAREE